MTMHLAQATCTVQVHGSPRTSVCWALVWVTFNFMYLWGAHSQPFEDWKMTGAPGEMRNQQLKTLGLVATIEYDFVLPASACTSILWVPCGLWESLGYHRKIFMVYCSILPRLLKHACQGP